MDTKVNYAVVGIFVLLLGAALIALLLWFGAGNFTRVAYSGYYVYMRESVSGLNVNAPVKYRGVEVGKVSEIVLDPENSERVRLTLEIALGVPIRTDTLAVLSVQGLTGIAFVDLTGGSRSAPMLKVLPGRDYPEISTGPSLLARVDMALNRALDNVNRLTDDVHALLEPDNRESVRDILQHVEALTAALASRDKILQETLDHAERAMRNTAVASEQLPDLLKRIESSAAAVQAMADEIRGTGTGPMSSFTQQTLPEAARLVNELRVLAASMQRVSQQLEREPGVLLYGGRTSPGPGE